jgi:AmmeMemoRadiSam system protein A
MIVLSQEERSMPRSTVTPPSGQAGGPQAPPNDLPPPVSVTAEEREALLTLARVALAAAVGAAPGSSLASAIGRHPGSGRRAAVFVTLTDDGELRGCIGHMDASSPVQESVVEAATWAALEDPRFPRVRAAELPQLHVEVSVLGRLVPLADPAMFRLGIDGIVVERNGRRGLLLPEVAAMLGNDRTAMLDTACRKAGLPQRAWREPGTGVFAFRTDRFGGAAVAGPVVDTMVDGQA